MIRVRVYCSKCKHLQTESLQLSSYSCSHPVVVRAEVTNSWFKSDMTRLEGDPKVLNKDNNCQYYEEKT